MTTPSKPAIHAPTSARSSAKATPASKLPSPNTTAAIALSMSWQLLVVLVLPLVGGHLLDARYHTSPLWVSVGMVVAAAGTIAVITRTVRELGGLMNQDSKEQDKS